MARKKRHTSLSETEYARIRISSRQAYNVAAEFLGGHRGRNPLAYLFWAGGDFGRPETHAFRSFLDVEAVASPGALADVPPIGLGSARATAPNATLVRSIRGLARSASTEAFAPSYISSPRCPYDGNGFLNDNERRQTQFAERGNLETHAPNNLNGMPKRPFLKLGHIRNTQTPPKTNKIPNELGRFCCNSSYCILLKQETGALPPIASDFRCYFGILPDQKHRPLPANRENSCVTELCIRRGVYFRKLRPLLQDRWCALNFTTGRLTPMARHIIKVMGKCQNRSSPHLRKEIMILKIAEPDAIMGGVAQSPSAPIPFCAPCTVGEATCPSGIQR